MLRVEQRVSSARRDLAVHGRRPAAAGRHGVRPVDPRADRPGRADASSPACAAVHAVDAAGVHPLLLAIGSERYTPYAERQPAAGTADAGQRHAGPGANVAGQISVDRGRRRRSAARHSRRRRFLATRAGAGRLAARFAFSNLHDDRHARLFGQRPERRLEAGDRRRRAADPRLPTNCRRLRLPADAATRLRRRRVPQSAALPAGRAGGGGPGFRPRRGGTGLAIERFCAAYRPRRRDQSLSAGGDGRRQRIRRRVAGEFSVGDVHAQQSGGRRARHRRRSRSKSIGAAAARW